MTELATFERLVGANIARLRKASGASQSHLAEEMALRGLAWQRSTVAQVETGRRAVSLAEALALADELRVPVSELVRAEAPVRVGDGTWHQHFLSAAVAGTSGNLPAVEGYTSPASERLARLVPLALGVGTDLGRRFVALRQQFFDRWEPKTVREHKGALKAITELERTTAADIEKRLHLGVHPEDIVMAAQRRWGSSLGEERDQRTAERAPDGASDRTLQAFSGLVMRQLKRELEEELEEAADRAAKTAVERER